MLLKNHELINEKGLLMQKDHNTFKDIGRRMKKYAHKVKDDKSNIAQLFLELVNVVMNVFMVLMINF